MKNKPSRWGLKLLVLAIILLPAGILAGLYEYNPVAPNFGMEDLLVKAKKGDPEAALSLSRYYSNTLPMTVNDERGPLAQIPLGAFQAWKWKTIGLSILGYRYRLGDIPAGRRIAGVYAAGTTGEDKQNCISALLDLSQKGDAPSQYQFALLLCNQNCKAAEGMWLEKAALQRYQPAEWRLAMFYETTEWGLPNYPKALRWYKTVLADTHSPEIFYKVGQFYEEGWGVKADPALALKYYFQAVQGHYLTGDVGYSIGHLYEKGLGTSKDLHKAIHYYKLAVDAGSFEADKALSELGFQYHVKEMEGDEGP